MILTKKFYSQPTKQLAKALLGTFLVRESSGGRSIGRIVETEAYLSTRDPACHAARGRTQRNAQMFEAAGTSYVYLIYGMYHCFNVVSSKPGVGEAVLIRALEPIYGIELMQKRRNKEKLTELASGPGKLCSALGIDLSQNGSCLRKSELWIEDRSSFKSLYKGDRGIDVKSSARIGISVGEELPLRFFLKDSPFVSKFRNR